VADGLPVVIIELAPPFRVLTLGGRTRPKPIRVGSEQRAVQTWYPGSGKASTQVMGVREDPLIMEGRWDDPLGTILPQTNPFGAGVRVKLARGIQQGQNLCLCFWGTTIVKQGRLERFEVLFQKANRTDYRIVFAVDAANEPVALTPLPLLTIDASALIAVAAAVSVAASIATNAADSGSEIGGAA
jgi:hypothetical protein